MPPRFEKSLYDLIRGLRNHKGNEKEYIQNSLKECRTEIRGADMGTTLSLRPDPLMPMLTCLNYRRKGYSTPQARLSGNVRA